MILIRPGAGPNTNNLALSPIHCKWAGAISRIKIVLRRKSAPNGAPFAPPRPRESSGPDVTTLTQLCATTVSYTHLHLHKLGLEAPHVHADQGVRVQLHPALSIVLGVVDAAGVFLNPGALIDDRQVARPVRGTPVSYTHLDVYKRQVLSCLYYKACRSPHGERGLK